MSKLREKLAALAGVLALLAAQTAAAQALAAASRHSVIRAGDPSRIAALVESRIVPHFDFRRVTQIAMGANWRRATPEQQTELTRQFKQLLVRTYSGALASYRDQVIEVRPLRAKADDAEVTVRSVVKQ